MAEQIIIIDTNVLKSISRGNQRGADALIRYRNAGIPVHISQASYNEIVNGAPNPFMGSHYKEMLKDMRITVAPPGRLSDRLEFHIKNMDHVPAPETPGQIKEYGSKKNPDRPGDAFVAAQVHALKASGAELLTFDQTTMKRASNLGVKTHADCKIGDVTGAEDPVAGRKRLGLNPVTIGSNGAVSPPPPSGGTGTKAQAVTITGSPATPGLLRSERGEAIGGGILLALEALNIGLNYVNDHVQKNKIEEAKRQIRSTVDQVQRENRRMGVLVLYYHRQYEPERDSAIRPGPVFDYIVFGKGLTRDEALRDALKQPTIGPGGGGKERKFAQETWIAPEERLATTTAKPPFPQVGIGQFFLGNSIKAVFQLVEFNTFGGFDDIAETSVAITPNENVQFVVLHPPSEVFWFNQNGKQSTGVPITTAKTSNGNQLKVVDLDPWSPFAAKAAMVFPLEILCERLFGRVDATRNVGMLGTHMNLGMVRWVRAENIHMLQFG